MEEIKVVQMWLGVAAACFGLMSCALWIYSARLKVPASKASTMHVQAIYTHKGVDICELASARKQSEVSGYAAISAAIAALAQAALAGIPLIWP
ncbi:hypothetical protein [Pseudomonas sp. Sample_22]|uniref:hypothetical protein n=1 Tax=Pseudomonas sp. Sample_22 TaxID=2448266 RepID=UPI001032F160|nr:hypothetical protein [Pseudomonas sp. Sample_22]